MASPCVVCIGSGLLLPDVVCPLCDGDPLWASDNPKDPALTRDDDIRSSDILSQGSGPQLLRIKHADVVELLKVGTVQEAQERAAKARLEKSKKGQWARDAYEVLEILAQGGYQEPYGSPEWVSISEDVCKAVGNSIHYPEEQWHSAGMGKVHLKPDLCNIAVQNCTVLSATQELALSAVDGPAPGALNFASARNPGGGFTTGAAAQEESIARSSALYPCLTKFFQDFFVPSRRAPSGSYTHDLIYSPSVPVLRGDDGQLLDQPYYVDFVTAAAPNVGSMKMGTSAKSSSQAQNEAETILRERIPRVLEVFVRHGAVDLVLGAWGCGVFGNDPAVVARIFKEELQGRFHCRFRRVIFAVLDSNMAQAFGAEFGMAVVPPSSAGSKWGAQRKWGGKA